MSEQIRTDDLWEAALGVGRGLALVELEITHRPNGRHQRVIFVLAGDRAREMAHEYRAGRAEANVSVLKHSVTYLRKRLFAALGEDVRR